MTMTRDRRLDARLPITRTRLIMAIHQPHIRRPAPAPPAAAPLQAMPAAAERPAGAATHDFGAIRVTAADDAHERQARALARRIAPALAPGARPERAPLRAAPQPFLAAAAASPRHAAAGPADGAGAFTASPGISAALRGARGAGEPLSTEMRAGAEAALGTGLDGVALHRDARADHLARALGARAVTTGRDVFFRRGAYAPGTAAGRERIAHELVHVAQQAESGGAPVAQREFVDDGGDTDANFGQSDWFKKLSPLQQKIARDLHAAPQKITGAGAAGAVRTEENRQVGAAARPNAHPFSAHLGYKLDGTYEQGLVEADDDTPADAELKKTNKPYTKGDVLKATNEHYEKDIVSRVEDSQETWSKELAEGSSESETEVERVVGSKVQGGADPVAADLSVRARRRAYKSSQLAAIAGTFFPLTDKEMQFRDELAAKRTRDNQERPDKLQMYAGDTRTHFLRVGEQFKQTSLYHNPYLRRAFRAAVKKEKVQEGGSGNYDGLQGNIRERLLKGLKRDHEAMQWTRDDFADDRTWEAVQFMMRQAISNDASKKKQSFHQSLEAGDELEKSSPRMAFHHVAWKESMNKAFEGFALTPANLTALNDLREVMDVKKLKALKAQGLPLPPVGAHDKIGHQLTGFTKGQQEEFKRSQGGGQFKDIDLEAVRYTLLPLLQPRTRKRFLYDPGVIAQKPAQVQHEPEPIDVEDVQPAGSALDVDLSGVDPPSMQIEPVVVQQPKLPRELRAKVGPKEKFRGEKRDFVEDAGDGSDSDVEDEDRGMADHGAHRRPAARKPTKKDAKIERKARFKNDMLYAQMGMADSDGEESDEELPQPPRPPRGEEHLRKKVKTDPSSLPGTRASQEDDHVDDEW
jgi:hypothetical protein